MPNQLKRELAKQIENRKNPTGRLLPHKDVFYLLTPRLKGKDLIRACNSSQEVNAKCAANNFQVFKTHLLDEFHIDFNQETHGYPDAKALYMQMHSLYAVIHTPHGQNHREVASVWDGNLRGAHGDPTFRMIIPPYNLQQSPTNQFYVLLYIDVHLGYEVLDIQWQDEDETHPARVNYDGPDDFLRSNEFLERIDFVLSTNTPHDNLAEGLSIIQMNPVTHVPRLIGWLYEVRRGLR